ncbi:MAG: ABC transporter permease, partial [Burkholderiales bacterium]
MKLSILWTDWLIYLLVVSTIVFVLVVRRHEHLRAPWRKVFHSASGMISLTVLSFFVAVGLLDSVH